MNIGFIGLGKMGSRMAGKLLQEGHALVVWNRSEEGISNFKSNNAGMTTHLKVATTIEELLISLPSPRIVWSMLPSGNPTENMLQKIVQYLEPGDIIIDGGNANYKDTQRRSEELHAKGIRFLGIGVSGGVIAATNGYPVMAGGDKSAYELITPILDSLAKPNGGHAYFGEGGAGHFVKMVHNGMEYGMMQAIGEGFAVLQKSAYTFDLAKVAKLWQQGTIISGLLMDCAAAALEKDPQVSDTIGIIPRGGEADWTIEAAKEEGIPVENIEQSRDFRKRSETDTTVQNSYTAKMVNALRYEFGGHPVKKK